MDPSATLAQCRKLLQAKDLTLSDCVRILDAFQNLDDWITRHGELPRQWKKAHDNSLIDLAAIRNAGMLRGGRIQRTNATLRVLPKR